MTEMTPYQRFISLSRYSRYLPDKKRRETWEETVTRYVDYFAARSEHFPRDKMYEAIVNMKTMPSMRALMTAGKALTRDNVAQYNCSYIAVDDVRAFDEALFILMCGVGLGFSVERQFIAKLPEIAEDFFESDTVIKVMDSKIGWATSLRELIGMLYGGKIPKWDLSALRPAGAPLKTFGGRACLTGDTILYKDRKKSRGYNEITIKDLFDMQNSAGFWQGKANHFKDVRLRSLDEMSGQFFRNRVLAVVDNGESPVYEIVTEHGYRIKATDNHRFMNDTGNYQYVSDFKVDDLIAVNGSSEPKTGICILSYDKIISIEYRGIERVYDLQMEGPNHNFVANGFVSHNSGPGPLNDLFKFTVNLFKKAKGRKLNSVECHDLMCKIADVVVVGGVRRSALISLSNLSDDRMRHAKTGQWWIDEPQRALANNSAAYTEKPNTSQFMEEWLALYNSKSGERGIVNRVAAKNKIRALGDRRKPNYDWGVNPCLTGETLVYVADGRNAIPIKELADSGKDVDVFCFDDKQNIVVRTMRNPRITGFNVPVFKMTLDDGSIIRATENHKFLTKDGSYKELKDLVAGESLNIITKFEASIQEMMPNGNKNTKKYWWISKSINNPKSEHRIIAEHAYGEIPKGYVVHHKNFDAKDNSPDNLQVMSKADHDRLHGDLMMGENNPMVRAQTEWSEEKWEDYRKNMSNAVSGQKNGRFSGHSNEDLREYAMQLTKDLGHKFSTSEWLEYAKKHDLPQHFSKWREDHFGGISGLAKSCALELGLEMIDIDPRTLKNYKKAVDSGYDAEIIEGKIYINKKCEVCGTPFQTIYKKREHGVCSQKCASKRIWEDTEYRSKCNAAMKASHEEKRTMLRELQAKVYSNLKFNLGREPQKIEWQTSCKEQNISCEISRKSSPFTSFNQLKEAASMYNHKVVSIEFDGYEDVYNGTVDEYHNFFVGAFEGEMANGRKKFIFINNLNCGEIILRPHGFCNLTEVVIREDDTFETLKEKVENAVILGTFQSSLTDFRYLRSIWRKNAEEERLLGVSLTGIMDHPILSTVNDEAREWLRKLKDFAIDVNKEWADKLGIPQSAAITTVKPSGCQILTNKMKTNTGKSISLEEIFNLQGYDKEFLQSLPEGTWLNIKPELNNLPNLLDENNEPQNITKLYVNGQREIFEITFEDGNSYGFTGNHKLKTKDGWKRVDELTQNDEIISF